MTTFELIERYIELKIADATEGASLSYSEFLGVEGDLKRRLDKIDERITQISWEPGLEPWRKDEY